MVCCVELSAANRAGKFAGNKTLSPATKPEEAVVVNVIALPVEFPVILLRVALTIPLLVALVTVAVFEAPLLDAAVTEPVRVVDELKVEVVPNFHAH